MLNKKRLLVLAKITLSVGLIYWLLQGADLKKIWETVREAHGGYLFLAFLMFYIGFFLIAIRWRLLLQVKKINAGVGYLLESVNIGVLFNNLLPSTIGGDAYRMYDVWRLGGTKTTAVSVILIDRFLGMFALVSYGIIAALLVEEVREAIPGLVLYLVAILVAMIGVMWVVFGHGSVIMDWFMGLQTRLLSIPQKIVGKIIEALELFKGRADVLLKAILISFGVQLNVIIHFIIVAYALNIDVPPLSMFIIIPLATLIMLLPVSINGVGVREAVLVFFFGLYGVSAESAIAFAWVWLGMLLAQGLVGGMVFLFRRNKSDRQKVQEMMHESAET